MESSLDISAVIGAHMSNMHQMCLPVIGGPKACKVIGNMIPYADDPSVPIITLLLRGSTLRFVIPSLPALIQFDLAMRNLITAGRSFYTQLRPEYGLSVILWERI